ncbi:ribosomal protein S18-alanine N-acetyltransferase [Marinomonas pollencensis]|uniref:[Ribosomal protein bS18]-alanine N-acetyltransferase n=1 Tax=Marinomonas pollencensis TaxID=491954 RepID=A0A3E0DID0_9GAMM|nr:ribosomal protein S18-alanine N-acetyltransferase [Marinomonas pollencensis]REG82439.1 ribosomal-protein-alanine N-acetyltransferase [Marinomonas pollencensis]
MPSFTTRPATEKDFAAILRLDQSSNPYPWSDALIEEALASRFNWLVEQNTGTSEARVVAWLTASMLLEQSELELIVVDQTQRRQGLGRKLLETWIEQMVAKGVLECLLEVRESNLGAIHLYRSLGFIEVGRRKNYYATEQGKEAACLFTLTI